MVAFLILLIGGGAIPGIARKLGKNLGKTKKSLRSVDVREDIKDVMASESPPDE